MHTYTLDTHVTPLLKILHILQWDVNYNCTGVKGVHDNLLMQLCATKNCHTVAKLVSYMVADQSDGYNKLAKLGVYKVVTRLVTLYILATRLKQGLHFYMGL